MSIRRSGNAPDDLDNTIRKYKKSLSFSEDVTTIVEPSSLEEHHRRRSVVNKDFSLGQILSYLIVKRYNIFNL